MIRWRIPYRWRIQLFQGVFDAVMIPVAVKTVPPVAALTVLDNHEEWALNLPAIYLECYLFFAAS
jgi:hypothetical protein